MINNGILLYIYSVLLYMNLFSNCVQFISEANAIILRIYRFVHLVYS